MICKMKLFLLAVICLSSGCARMLPYGDSYDCPQMEQGQCVSVEAAHAYALTGSRGAPSAAREDLDAAIEKYRKAVMKGQAGDIELSREELLRLISPEQADAFAEALERFRQAVMAKEPGKTADAERQLRTIHMIAVASARDSARLEYAISSEATRQEFLGKYAQGQKAPAVLMPPVIMETHILPYQTEFNTLAGERTMWIPVEQARWTWPDKFNGGRNDEIGSASRGR